jgi:hypothetical protein
MRDEPQAAPSTAAIRHLPPEFAQRRWSPIACC